MIDVDFKRLESRVEISCNGCNSEIRCEQPYFKISINSLLTTISLCEDCGNHLQNDMSDEYCEFVDLGK